MAATFVGVGIGRAGRETPVELSGMAPACQCSGGDFAYGVLMSSFPPPYEQPPGQVPPPYGSAPYGTPPYGAPSPGYPAAPYGSPYGYGRPPARNGLAITSMVLGILALALSWTSFPGVILGVLALVFGIVAIARARRDRVSNKGMAIAGIVTGVAGAIIGAVIFIAAFRIAGDCRDQFGGTITEAELEQCVEDSVTG